MKTEIDVRNEITLTRKNIDKVREEYKNEKIPKDVFSNKIIDLMATIDALMWVLDENERYD